MTIKNYGHHNEPVPEVGVCL